MLLAVVFASLGRAYPKTGGPYVYARRAFGDFIGFQTAWGYWIAAPGRERRHRDGLRRLHDRRLARAEPTATLTTGRSLTAIGSIWLFTFINILGVQQAGTGSQLVTTILKFVPLALIGVIGLFFMNAGQLQAESSRRPDTAARQRTDDAARDHGRHRRSPSGRSSASSRPRCRPRRSRMPSGRSHAPRIWGTLGTALIYVVATIAVMGILPLTVLRIPRHRSPTRPPTIFGGSAGGRSVALVGMISTFGALNGWMLLQGAGLRTPRPRMTCSRGCSGASAGSGARRSSA